MAAGGDAARSPRDARIMKRPGDRDEGMILVNVLLFVAIASGLALLMVNREELALNGALRMREAARAQAIVRGGELSAIVALRRDATEAPEADHRGEPWAALAEAGAAIDGGSFDLVVADAEGRFNVNNLMSGEAAPVIQFQALAREAGLDEEQVLMAIGYVRAFGPVTDLRPMRAAGIDPDLVDRLQQLVTALPGQTMVNINAAPRDMLIFFFRDPAIVDRLIAVRERTGQITLDDLGRENVVMPAGARFASDTFWVHTRATIGGTRQSGAALIRRRAVEGGVAVEPVARWRGAAVPPEAPALPAAS